MLGGILQQTLQKGSLEYRLRLNLVCEDGDEGSVRTVRFLRQEVVCGLVYGWLQRFAELHAYANS